MGEIRKRGGVYWIRWYREGRRFEESAKTDKWETARDLLRDREGDVAKGMPISARIGRLRFEDAAKDLLTDYQINGKRSYENLKNTVIDGALEPWFRGRRMASLTTSDVRGYVADRQKDGYANATINRELAALKRMFTLAIQAGKLLQRPHIPMLAENNIRKGFFERAQFEAVRNRLAPTYQALVTLAYYSGWRINSELLPLEWRQIDRKAGWNRGPRRTETAECLSTASSMKWSPSSRASGRATRRWKPTASSRRSRSAGGRANAS